MQKISKVVIPAAGIGTRLLPTTKEQPKEMLPIFGRSNYEGLLVKPILQVIFEQLYDFGLREFYFIVGRTKRAIEDHFTPDFEYIDKLSSSGKTKLVRDLKDYYHKLNSATLVWINQPSPKGFGHSVLLSKNLIGDNQFLVHAGDTVIISQKNRHLSNLTKQKSSEIDDCRILVKKVDEPRQFGVIEGIKSKGNLIKVTGLEEKPSKPKTNLAIMPLYRFDPVIFKSLEKTKPDKHNEIQLTDGIKQMKNWGLEVTAQELHDSDIWIDVGSPETYWQALYQTHQFFSLSKKKSVSLQRA